MKIHNHNKQTYSVNNLMLSRKICDRNLIVLVSKVQNFLPNKRDVSNVQHLMLNLSQFRLIPRQQFVLFEPISFGKINDVTIQMSVNVFCNHINLLNIGNLVLSSCKQNINKTVNCDTMIQVTYKKYDLVPKNKISSIRQTTMTLKQGNKKSTLPEQCGNKNLSKKLFFETFSPLGGIQYIL